MGEKRVVRVQEEPRWKWLAAPTAILALAATAMFATVSSTAAAILVGVLIGYVRSKAHSTTSLVDVELEDGELRFAKRPHLSGRRLLGARAGAEPEQILLTADDGSIMTVRTISPEAARDLLRAIRPPRTSVSGRVPGLGDLFTFAITVALFSVGIVLAAAPIAWPLALALPLAAAAWVRSMRQVVAGDDGIEVRRRGQRRFVPYADIARIDAESVVLRSGEVVALGTDPWLAAFDPGAKAADADLIERARAGLARSVETGASRTAPELEGALAAADAHGQEGFREVAIPEEDLFRLLDRPDVSAADRSRAADLLRQRVAPAELRLRIADLASSSAREETRQTLFRIAAPEAEEVEAPQSASALAVTRK